MNYQDKLHEILIENTSLAQKMYDFWAITTTAQHEAFEEKINELFEYLMPRLKMVFYTRIFWPMCYGGFPTKAYFATNGGSVNLWDKLFEIFRPELLKNDQQYYKWSPTAKSFNHLDDPSYQSPLSTISATDDEWKTLIIFRQKTGDNPMQERTEKSWYYVIEKYKNVTDLIDRATAVELILQLCHSTGSIFDYMTNGKETEECLQALNARRNAHGVEDFWDKVSPSTARGVNKELRHTGKMIHLNQDRTPDLFTRSPYRP